MTRRPRPQPLSRPQKPPPRRGPQLLAFAAALGWPLVGVAAEGGLQIMPNGFAENWAEHGLLALFYMKHFWMLVLLFAALAVLLNRFGFTPLLEVIDERNRRMAGARERAAELSGQVESLLSRHGEALRQARERVQTERQSLLEQARDGAQAKIDEARGDAEQQTQAARREVDAALDTARSSLRDDADQVAEVIADRLLGGSSA